MTSGVQPAAYGTITAQKIMGILRPTTGLVRDDVNGHYYRHRRGAPGKYVYDVQMTLSSAVVTILRGTFTLLGDIA